MNFIESFTMTARLLPNASFTPSFKNKSTCLNPIYTLGCANSLTSKKRKVAIRLGKLAEEQAHYTIHREIVKKLCNGKLACKEGIDFVLDPLGAPIKPDLFEHINGLRTCDKAYTQDACKQLISSES